MLEILESVYPSQQQLYFVVEGMRNPMNSWMNMDTPKNPVEFALMGEQIKPGPILGFSDMILGAKLSNRGEPHRKYMRMLQVGMRVNAPMYWWKEFDTYKVGTVRNSCSTMHKIMSKEFELKDFSHDWLDERSERHLEGLLIYMNYLRNEYIECADVNEKKDIWNQVIQLLPSSYNQISNVTLNYETLCNIYKWRRKHKLREWHIFCDWIEQVPYHELITDPKAILED